jgi:hypothetical protein
MLVVSAVALATGWWRVDRSPPAQASEAIAESAVPLPRAAAARSRDFNDYWYQGLAEVNRYELRQSRYGDLHDGEAVLIFVTEDFHRTDHVKVENGDGEDAVSILKLNATRRFYTGVYPYTIMSSIFTPVQPGPASSLKVTTSIQEWCGHTYTQLDLTGDRYQSELRSYLRAESDRTTELPRALLEDELLNLIRRDPAALPQGPIELIPAIRYQRLTRQSLVATDAVATLRDAEPTPGWESTAALEYQVDYIQIDRRLSVTFEADFPHRILAWTEARSRDRDAQEGAESGATSAILARSVMLDYWNHNSADDHGYREHLGLGP